ncbi:hypothetical protein AAVH_36151 [Aphelenchoides avenae]|nr:hypothetical protein AAVH_36151 [Aphelenchus avenae]
MLFHQRPEANILIWKKRSDTCNDTEKLDWVRENKAHLLDALGKWTKQDVSALHSKIKAFQSGSRAGLECFQGVAIVKCAYRFVWYELGWTYFHATSDCDDFSVKVGGEGYRQCLQIVFLG